MHTKQKCCILAGAGALLNKNRRAVASLKAHKLEKEGKFANLTSWLTVCQSDMCNKCKCQKYLAIVGPKMRMNIIFMCVCVYIFPKIYNKIYAFDAARSAILCFSGCLRKP